MQQTERWIVIQKQLHDIDNKNLKTRNPCSLIWPTMQQAVMVKCVCTSGDYNNNKNNNKLLAMIKWIVDKCKIIVCNNNVQCRSLQDILKVYILQIIMYACMICTVTVKPTREKPL